MSFASHSSPIDNTAVLLGAAVQDDRAELSKGRRNRARLPDMGRDQISKRQAGCDVGPCRETEGSRSRQTARSAFSVTIDEKPIARTGAKAGTGGIRMTSLL